MNSLAGTGLDDAMLTEMLGDFLDESQGYLALLNTRLLELDELIQSAGADPLPEVDLETLNEMFRAAHSLKGLSGMLQLEDINRLTHKVENVFDAARNRVLPITGNVTEVIFQAVDRLAAMVEQLKTPKPQPVECQQVIDAMRDLLEGTPRAEQPEPSAPVAPAPAKEIRTSDPFEGVVDDGEISPKYLAIFLDETGESLDALSALLMVDGSPPVDPLLALCHRVKGSAAAIGLRRAAKLTHAMEDLLHEIRESGAAVSETGKDALLQCVDALRIFLGDLRDGVSRTEVLTKAFGGLAYAWRTRTEKNVSETAKADSVTEPAALQLTASERQYLISARPDQNLLIGLVRLEADLPLSDIKARLVYKRLQGVGELVVTTPSFSQLELLTEVDRLTFALAGAASEQQVLKALALDGVAATTLERFDPTQPAAKGTVASTGEGASNPTPERVASSDGGKSRPTETVRVDIDRLDHLMNLAGQLTISKARFSQIGDRLSGLTSRRRVQQSLADITAALERIVVEVDDSSSLTHAGGEMASGIKGHVTQIQHDLEVVRADLTHFGKARILSNELGEAVHQLERISSDIQKSVMDTRMVPIGPLFDRFKRVVRDVTRGNGKEIQLVIRGEKTELDKRMIDELSDPLIHMVRNSADHGIEAPAVREANGKPRRGVVTLDAFHRGNRIVIQVRDDGKGLDAEKIRAKAVEKGLLSAADAQRLTQAQVFQLIWEPGFSTAEKVTEVSGRGMGMDIVRSKIEALNGAIELDSRPGEGTTITIKLPLTMAILPSLLTVIGDVVYAVPVESVVEIVRAKTADCATVHGVRTVQVRGRVISLVELSDIFGSGTPVRRERAGDVTVVIVGADGDELGLAVDDLIGEEDVVIKSLAENYRNIGGLAGASILGDGRVSLILDVAALITFAGRPQSIGDHETRQPIEHASTRSISR
jgi:two-component system chemotaxis sensor kinase CheA